jgi:archaellum component FlaC
MVAPRVGAWIEINKQTNKQTSKQTWKDNKMSNINQIIPSLVSTQQSEVREQLCSIDTQLSMLSEKVTDLTSKLIIVLRPFPLTYPKSDEQVDKSLVELASELRDKRRAIEIITMDISSIVDRLEL